MKKLLLVLLLAVVSIGITYAYIMTTFKTNELTIQIGTQDAGNATLTDLQPGYVLIPTTAIVSQVNETKMLEYHFLVQSTDTKSFTISHNLPEQFTLTHNNTNTYFTTGTTYTITVKLNEPLDITNQVFYIDITLV